MSVSITVREMLALCPYQSLVGGDDASLARNPPAAIMAVPKPGLIDHDGDDIAAIRDLLGAGKTVLVMCATYPDRETLLDLLGIRVADRIRQGGRA